LIGCSNARNALTRRWDAAQELMQASVAQQDALRMLASAISEASRGKDAAMAELARHPLIAVHLLGSEQQSDALVEGNARLRGELDESRRKIKKDAEKVSRRRVRAASPTPSSPSPYMQSVCLHVCACVQLRGHVHRAMHRRLAVKVCLAIRPGQPSSSRRAVAPLPLRRCLVSKDCGKRAASDAAARAAFQVKALQKERDLLKGQLAAVRDELSLAHGDTAAEATAANGATAAAAGPTPRPARPSSPPTTDARPHAAGANIVSSARPTVLGAALPPPPLDVGHADDGTADFACSRTLSSQPAAPHDAWGESEQLLPAGEQVMQPAPSPLRHEPGGVAAPSAPR
jgi:hypothetical protein